jgi:iron(III) transport system substrate-binding protein
MLILCVAAVLLGALCACSHGSKEIVVYTSVDQPFAEPVLQSFEQATGIHVRAVYDVEAAKTTGLVNRLIAEKARPQADVFWNSEIVRMIVLKRQGVLASYRSPAADGIPSGFRDPEGFWTGFAARCRVLLINTKLVKESDRPKSILELAEPKWRGRVAIPYPLFGTTSAHVAALFLTLGDVKARNYFQQLKANDVLVVDGNAASRDRVADGDVAIGFTDTDDANVAVQAGKPVRVIYPDQEGMGTLLIPNTVSLIADCPHAEAGKRLIDYLLSAEVEERLAAGESAQIPLRAGVKTPATVRPASAIKTMPLDYGSLADKLDDAMKFAQETFAR